MEKADKNEAIQKRENLRIEEFYKDVSIAINKARLSPKVIELILMERVREMNLAYAQAIAIERHKLEEGENEKCQ